MADADKKNVFTLVNVDFAALGDTAKILVNRVGDLIGGALRPRQIRRIAEAEADAKITGTMAEIHAESLERRAAQRWLNEETMKQANMEAITHKALPEIKADAKPEKIEQDWLVNFFDKARLTSDEEMQKLWAKILAGEANTPGKFSKRTVNLLASLDKNDAEQFQFLCRHNWIGFGIHGLAPLVFEPEVTESRYAIIMRLREAGLISYDSSVRFTSTSAFTADGKSFGPVVRVRYGERRFALYTAENHYFAGRRVDLTRAGHDLASFCSGEIIPELYEIAFKYWKADGVVIREAVSDEQHFPQWLTREEAMRLRG